MSGFVVCRGVGGVDVLRPERLFDSSDEAVAYASSIINEVVQATVMEFRNGKPVGCSVIHADGEHGWHIDHN